VTSATTLVLSARRASVLTRLRRRAFRLLPLLVWTAASGLFYVLVRHRTPAPPVKAVAETARYSVVAPLDGELAAWTVRDRETVAAGQVVGQLQDESVRLQLASATLELDRLRAELRSAESGFETTRLADRHDREVDRIAELRRLHRDVESARLDALSTRAVIEEARVRQEGIAIELARLLDLDGQGITSGSELTLQRTEHDSLQKRVAELQVVLAGHEDRVRASRERVAAFEATAADLEPGHDALLDPFRWQIRVQEIVLEQVALAMCQMRLVAPAAGIVEEIRFRPGERVAAGEILLTVVEPRSRGIVAYVPEQLRNTIRCGTPVEVERSDAPGTVLTSRVASVSPAVVLVPMRLWTDPRIEEWALAVYLEPTGEELPGQRLFVRWR
jgi:HlyD family secretion protein